MSENLSEDEYRDFDDNDEWRMPQFPPAKKLKTTQTKCTESEGKTGEGTEKFSDLKFKSRLGHQRTIIQVDIDCFYAQVEMVRDPSLRDVPLGVQQRNSVVTCNYVARSRGVTKMMYVREALLKCPELVLVRGEDLTPYREFSSRVTSLLVERFTPLVERLGLDENFLDVSALVASRLDGVATGELQVVGKNFGQKSQIRTQESNTCHCGCHVRLTMGSIIASEIRQAILAEVGLTSCAGIAHSKLLAKLVRGCHKPNMQTTLFPGSADELLATLKARQIPGIGHSTAKKLDQLGIESVVDLQNCPLETLQATFGRDAVNAMKALSYGIDDSGVKPSDGPKTISDEDSFPKCSTLADAKERLHGLILSLLPRLTTKLGTPQTVRLSIRRHGTSSYKRESRQCPLPETFTTANKNQRVDILCGITVRLLQKLVDVNKPFHLMLFNVCLANFQKHSSSDSKVPAITSFFKTKTSSSSADAKEQCRVQEGRVFSSDVLCEPQSTATPLPDHIDPAVFSELPPEIQQELQVQWQQYSEGTIAPNRQVETAQRPLGILKYFTKK